MASFLKPFKFAWKELDQALNKIADAINANAPLEGTGIYLDEKGGNGVSINRSDTKGSSGNNSDNQQQQQQTQQGTWVTITAFDSNGDPVTLNVLSLDGKFNSTDTPVWTSVALIDPVTCKQTPKTILAKQ